MSQTSKLSAKIPLLEINAELFPSAFVQVSLFLIIICIIGAVLKETLIIYIILGIIVIVGSIGIYQKKWRWIYYIGKLSRDIMQDGTGGSKEKLLTNVEDADIIEVKELPIPKKMKKKKSRKK